MDEELDLPKKIMIPAKEPTTYEMSIQIQYKRFRTLSY